MVLKTFTAGERLFAADLNDNFEHVDDKADAVDTRVDAVSVFVETGPETGNYTLALTDALKVVAMNPSAAATVTVPTNAAVAFPVGTIVGVYNMSSFDVTIAGDSGVTVRNDGDLGEFQEVSLRKRATDEWVLAGL